PATVGRPPFASLLLSHPPSPLSLPAVVRSPSTGGFKLWSAMACFLSTSGSTARALRFAQRLCLGARIVVEIELTIPWNVLRGCGPPETPFYIAPVQTFLPLRAATSPTSLLYRSSASCFGMPNCMNWCGEPPGGCFSIQ